MKKVIRLNENDIEKLVKKIIKETKDINKLNSYLILTDEEPSTMLVHSNDIRDNNPWITGKYEIVKILNTNDYDEASQLYNEYFDSL